jgi:hypothetical protein
MSPALKNLITLILAFAAPAFLSLGCATRQAELDPAFGGQPGAAAVEAAGWEEIKMLSDGAEVKIDTHGHFITSFNRCRQDAAGALALDQWNILASSLNAAIAMQPLQKEVCKPASRNPYALNGHAEVILPGGKRGIFDYRGGDVCTNIPDEAVAAALLKSLDRVLLQAFYENCGTPPAVD